VKLFPIKKSWFYLNFDVKIERWLIGFYLPISFLLSLSLFNQSHFCYLILLLFLINKSNKQKLENKPNNKINKNKQKPKIEIGNDKNKIPINIVQIPKILPNPIFGWEMVSKMVDEMVRWDSDDINFSPILFHLREMDGEMVKWYNQSSSCYSLFWVFYLLLDINHHIYKR